MKRTSKVLATILALVLIVGAVFCVSVLAEENTPALGQANVVYGDRISLAFTVDGYTGDGLVGIAVYKNEGDATPAYASFEKKVDNDVEYYETFGIAAKDIDTVYYVAVAEKDDEGKITLLSEKAAYSVAQYANDRLEDVEASDAQKSLYNAILKYNAAANELFAD